jgi:RNA exonuclease 4
MEELVALDAEYVGGGSPAAAAASATRGERVDLLARLSIVDGHGRVLCDEWVLPAEPVADYRTPISGVTEALLIEKGGRVFRRNSGFGWGRNRLPVRSQGPISGEEFRFPLKFLEGFPPKWNRQKFFRFPLKFYFGIVLVLTTESSNQF